MKAPLLLLHGAIGSQQQLLPLAVVLQHNFDVSTLNFSGHGGLPAHEVSFNIEFFAKNVINWLDEHGFYKINIFGYSMGGYVALYLAKYFPARVGKIFTLATKLYWDEDTAARESLMLNPAVIEEKLPKFAIALEERHAPEDWRTVLLKTTEMMFEMGKRNPLSMEDYMNIDHQVRLALGDKDKMVSLDETLNVFRCLKNSSLLILPDTSHPIESVPIDRLAFEIKTFFLR